MARFLIRACEVGSSAQIIQYILARPELNATETCFVTMSFRAEGEESLKPWSTSPACLVTGRSLSSWNCPSCLSSAQPTQIHEFV
jgi:hypothetical protein